MGWQGKPLGPTEDPPMPMNLRPPAASTGTTLQIADAVAALAAVGVTGDNLALSALTAAGVIDRTTSPEHGGRDYDHLKSEYDHMAVELRRLRERVKRLSDLLGMFHDLSRCRYPAVRCSVCEVLQNIDG